MARGARGVNALAATYPRLLRWSAFSLAVAVALVAFWGPLHRFPGEDGAAYLQAAKDALDGHDLYSRTVPGGLFGFIYPPFAALIFMPLAWLPLAIGIPCGSAWCWWRYLWWLGSWPASSALGPMPDGRSWHSH